MERPDALFGFGAAGAGLYHPDNAGWWARELLDARHAGLGFLLLNAFGPDIARSPNPLDRLAQALEAVGGGVRIALLDDTWMWGRAGVEPPWNVAPDLADAERAAEILYASKWRPFFQRVPRSHWFTVRGGPFIYFYNAGTLAPRKAAAAVVARMKDRFEADFGVRPFVAVDHAFFEDRNMPAVADSEFTWSTLKLADRRSRSTRNGLILDHFMVKWDAIGRERPGAVATPEDRVFKGPDLLEDLLQRSADADLAVIATWNDLGEGTGIERNYDYYHRGAWLAPDRFLQTVRRAQCAE
jgi:hypothetical protein